MFTREDLTVCRCNEMRTNLYPVLEFGIVCSNCKKRIRRTFHSHIEKIDGKEYIETKYLQWVLESELSESDESKIQYGVTCDPASVFALKLVDLSKSIVSRGMIYTSDVNYALLLVRRLSEIDNNLTSDESQLLRHFNDWPVHKSLTQSKFIYIKLEKLTEIVSKIHSILGQAEQLQFELTKTAFDLINFSELRRILLKLLVPSDNHMIPVFLEDDYWWTIFCYRYLESVTSIHLSFPENVTSHKQSDKRKITHAQSFYRKAESHAKKIKDEKRSYESWLMYGAWIEADYESKALSLKISGKDLLKSMSFIFQVTHPNSNNTFSFSSNVPLL